MNVSTAAADQATEIFVAQEGPRLVASLFTAYFYGAVSLLTLYYVRNFPRDRAVIRWIVGVSFITSTVQAVAIGVAQWQNVIETPDFDLPVLVGGSSIIASSIASCIVPIPVILAKILYAERCYWVRLYFFL